MWTKQTKLLQITAFSVGITILNQRIIWKDDIEFVTEFPCLLGHPVFKGIVSVISTDTPFKDLGMSELQRYPRIL